MVSPAVIERRALARQRREDAKASFRLSEVKVSVVPLMNGMFLVESQLFSDLTGSDLRKLIEPAKLDRRVHFMETGGGALMSWRPFFESRTAAQRAARIWRAKFARIDSAEALAAAEDR